MDNPQFTDQLDREVHTGAKDRIRCRKEACLGALMLMLHIRKVDAVEMWLRDPDILEVERESGGAGQKVTECREWMIGASAYELENGPNSLLDRTHPFWENTLEPALKQAAVILVLKKAYNR